jgi:hypothetical protein
MGTYRAFIENDLFTYGQPYYFAHDANQRLDIGAANSKTIIGTH